MPEAAREEEDVAGPEDFLLGPEDEADAALLDHGHLLVDVIVRGGDGVGRRPWQIISAAPWIIWRTTPGAMVSFGMVSQFQLWCGTMAVLMVISFETGWRRTTSRSQCVDCAARSWTLAAS